MAMAQRAMELKNRLENSNLPVIRPKDLDSIGIQQSDRCICRKKRTFGTDTALQNATNKQLLKEIKRHKLGRSTGKKIDLIHKISDHYALYHT